MTKSEKREKLMELMEMLRDQIQIRHQLSVRDSRLYSEVKVTFAHPDTFEQPIEIASDHDYIDLKDLKED